MARILVYVFANISIAVTVFYLLGLLVFLTDVGEEKCEMTFMYEYPQFIRVSNKIDKKYPKYGLYAYGEGRLTARVRNMYFDGIPVLFIPGNAGSHKQVRSLSSVAFRKALDANTGLHFDYFTVDLNDEFSGLYGPLLYDQLDYVNNSFYRIFELYKEKNKPPSIILIGHSMGGVIAKKLLSQLPEQNLVPIIIALATPSRRAPLMLDYHLKSFYQMPSGDSPATATVINLSGGYRDFLIPTILSKAKNESALNVVTTHVPLAWIENNHVQILWCKQLILALTRALFDSVDPKTNFISSNSTFRYNVFNHHLNHHSGIKIKNLAQYSDLIKVDFKGKWIESLLKQYTVQHLKGIKEPHWYMVKLTPLPGHDILNVLALNLEIVNWVYVCNANYVRGPSRVCPEAYQLTHLSEIAPSIKYKRRFIQLNLRELYRNDTVLTHVVFRSLPTDEPIVFHVDIHSKTERLITVDLPKWWSSKFYTLVERTPDKAVNLKMLLPGLVNVVQVYHLFVEPLQCSQENHHASVSLVTPWGKENHHSFFTKSERKSFHVRLFTSKPVNESKVPYLKFILDPSCTYKISIRSSWMGSLGQIARFYTPLLLTYVAVVVLLALRYQLSMLEKGYWPVIFSAVIEGHKGGFYALILTNVVVAAIKKFWPSSPKPDNWYIEDDGLDFVMAPFLLYLCSVGIVLFLFAIFVISLFTLESTVNKIALKFLTRTVIWSNYFMTFVHKVPAVVAGIMIFLSMTTCGSLALCLGSLFYFLRLSQMSQDFVEDIGWFVLKKVRTTFLNMFKKRQRSTNSTHLTEQKPGAVGTNNEQNLRAVGTKNEQKSGPVETNNDEQKCGPLETNIVEQKTGPVSTNHEEQTIDKDNIKTALKEIDIDDSTSIKKTESTSQNVSEVIETVDENSEKEIDVKKTPESASSQLYNIFSSSEFNTIFFHLTIFSLWCIITLINIPAVLTWAHNFKFNKLLSPDDSFWPGVALSACAFPLWQFEFPRDKKMGLLMVEFIVTVVIFLCLAFATVSLYRLNYLLTFVIVIVTVHQLVAPQKMTVEAKCDNEDDIKEKYDDIKKKID